MNAAHLTRQVRLAKKIQHRLIRLMADRPRARIRAEIGHQASREAYRASLPGSSSDNDFLAALRRDGIVSTTVDELGLNGVVDKAAPLVADLLGTSVLAGRSVAHLPSDQLASVPDIFRWGAGDRVLDLLERYFEVPVAYHGVYMRRDLRVELTSPSNLWHLDMEDRRVIKVIVYLTDVRDGDGGFRYVPLPLSSDLRQSLGLVYRLGADSRMRKLIPDDQWRSVGGPAGTVLICDTARLFHNGRRPQRRDRVALFYDYTSRRPLHPSYCKSAMPQRHLQALTTDLSDRVRDSVFWRPRLTEFDPVKHE